MINNHNRTKYSESTSRLKKLRTEAGFGRRWLINWITCVLVSLLFFVLLKPLENSSVFRALDRLGSDAIMRVYAAGWEEGGPTVILIDMGSSVLTADLADTLEKIRNAKPLAVGVDFLIVADPSHHKSEETTFSGASDHIQLDALLAVLRDDWGETRVALPAVNLRLASGIADLRSVRAAAPDFVRDEDGVVRTTRERVCTDSPEGVATLPTLAAAMVRDRVEPASHGCDPGDEPIPIFFGPIKALSTDPRSGVLLVPKEGVGAILKALRGAYVVLGHAEPGSTADTFMTPVGERPGALIHAEAVRTLAKGKKVDWWNYLPRWVPELSIGFLAGAVFALYTTAFSPERMTEAPGSFARSVYEFAVGGLGGLLLIASVLLLVGVLWTWFAAGLVERGLLIGALTPVFGAMLETLAHVGEYLVAPMKWLSSRLLRGSSTPVLLGLLFLSPCIAKAEGCLDQLTTVTGDLEDVVVDPGNRRVTRLPFHLEPFDHVIVNNARTKALVEHVSGSERREIRLGRGADPSESPAVVVPPCSPRPGLTGAWYAFWSALNPDPQMPLRSTGATRVYRGANSNQPGAGGPLRELTSIVPATGTVVGSSGFALAWAGGNPPYDIAIEDEASGEALGHMLAESRKIWLPEWRGPAEPFVVIVRDAEGIELWRHLRPLPPPPVEDSELGDAILLFETEPTYRLEALRRLVARAAAGDILAERAVDLLQVSGSGE